MSIYLLLPLIAFVSNPGLASMTVRGNWQASGQRAFALFLVAMATRGGLLFMMRSSGTIADAYFWDKLVVANVAIISVLYLHFTYGFTARSSARWVMPVAYALLGLVAASTVVGLTVTGMQIKSYGYAPVFGPTFALFLLLSYGAIFMGMANVWHTSRHGSSPTLRNRAGYVLVGTVISLTGGITDVLPTIGLPIYPLGIVGNILFAAIATIAMVKVRLLDIRLALQRAFAYGMVAVVVVGSYFAIDQIAELTFGIMVAQSKIAFNVLFVTAGVVAIPKLNDRAQGWVDKTFFGQRYSAFKALERFNEQMKDITEHQALAQSLVTLLRGAMDSEWVTLMEPDERRRAMTSVASTGTDETFELSFEDGASAVGRLAANGKVQSLQEVSLFPEWQSVPDAERSRFEDAAARLFVPIMSKAELTGVLVLGRRAGRAYSQEELDLLRTVANQAATAMENTRLYHELASQLDTNERRVAAFEHAAGRMALEQNPDLAIEQLVEEVMELVDTKYGAVAFWGPKGELTRVIGPGVGRSRSGPVGARLWVAELLENVGMITESPDGDGSVHSESVAGGIAVPFLCKDSGRGVFYLRDKAEEAEFTEADVRLVNLFAVLIGVLINNVEVFQSEARERSTLTAIQASMTEGLAVLDPYGYVQYFNRAAEDHWSMSASTVLGKRFLDAMGELPMTSKTPRPAWRSSNPSWTARLKARPLRSPSPSLIGVTCP
jgi:GAF domain-containing protein